jgi:2-keto-4-pentenoate hydratase/2-oxohepta-3-ene-1,7-dioic acid hydratase in catechol pathway
LFEKWIAPLVPKLEASAEKAGGGGRAMRLSIVGEFYVNARFREQALKDMSFAIAAILLVLVFMWLHAGSLFLAGLVMLQVVLAFPLAYFSYRLVAQIT